MIERKFKIGDIVTGVSKEQWLEYFICRIKECDEDEGKNTYKLEKVLCIKEGKNKHWTGDASWYENEIRLITEEERKQYLEKENKNEMPQKPCYVKIVHKGVYDCVYSLREYPKLYKKTGILVNHNSRQVFIINDSNCLEIIDMSLIIMMEEIKKL